MLQLIHFGNYQLSGGVFFQDLLVVNLVFFKIIYDCYKHTDSSTESYSRKSPRRIQNSLSNIVGGTFFAKISIDFQQLTVFAENSIPNG